MMFRSLYWRCKRKNGKWAWIPAGVVSRMDGKKEVSYTSTSGDQVWVLMYTPEEEE